jgi:hypothetical protein
MFAFVDKYAPKFDFQGKGRADSLTDFACVSGRGAPAALDDRARSI